jgi:hypothetical protein
MMPSKWHDWHDFYMLLGTASAAVAGLAYTTVVLVGLARASVSDTARFGYGIFPMASYVAMLAAAGLVISRATLARRHLGRCATPSTCDQYSQCLGSDAGFCAPSRKQELGHLSVV